MKYSFRVTLWFAISFTTCCAEISQAQTSAISECDRFAASPFDPTKPLEVPGVLFDSIVQDKAIPACAAASFIQSSDARLKFQYGRALHAGKQKKLALDVLKQAVDMGSLIAANSIGLIMEESKDAKAAVSWYEYAARQGLTVAKKNAAILLSNEDALPVVNHERAAIYWRSLADAGDAEAAEKVGLSIKSKKIAALNSGELDARLSKAADGGRFLAAYEYADHLSQRKSSPDAINRGAKYALLAYRLSIAAPTNTEEGWPLYQRLSFLRYDALVRAGAPNFMTSREYSQARADFPDNIRGFTVPIDCGGTRVPYTFYLWQWSREYPQSDAQAKWLDEARGCKFPEDVVISARKIYAIAAENNVSFTDLFAYGNGLQENVASLQNTTTQSKSTAQPNRAAELTDNEKTAMGVAAIGLGVACYIWSDKCKELAWEVTKEGAKETIRRSGKN